MPGADSSRTLELHEPKDAFRRIEEWLRGQGFFAGVADDLTADLYLGYGLSQAIRRKTSPPPREPCRLPLDRQASGSLETHGEALRIAERYGYSIFDSSIVASALEAGSDTLWSEGMQHGVTIDGRLRIANPFRKES